MSGEDEPMTLQNPGPTQAVAQPHHAQPPEMGSAEDNNFIPADGGGSGSDNPAIQGDEEPDGPTKKKPKLIRDSGAGDEPNVAPKIEKLESRLGKAVTEYGRIMDENQV